MQLFENTTQILELCHQLSQRLRGRVGVIESSGELPPTVYLFQRNLERVCGDREQLVEEIRVTLFHELGHALGFDEEGVARMGLE